MSTTSVPALLRQQVDRWAETWLKAKFTVYRGLTAADCFREIEGNEVFWPTT